MMSLRATLWMSPITLIGGALGSDGEDGLGPGVAAGPGRSEGDRGGHRPRHRGLSCGPAMRYRFAMDEERVNGRIDEAVLALLYLGIFESHPMGGARA